ncbi:hypothetical protein [Lyngbya confervoides]|uniref:Uncharacterized protein n=1 Tax=Lyngbya confervoides BDU141951 TaxID=1574623 RepID=A0ABD4T011_9CYAN|nr:hypothetical protein [Lyngbya confervoides]MCM1981869.1 hypothetical protein [Lyngbya confervoides BDU141951]
MNGANIDNSDFLPIISPAKPLNLAPLLQFSSSVCAVAGGVLLASNTPVSKYGFLLLALSSGQMLLTSGLTGNRGLMVYSGSVFCFVDCLGVYRWLLQ